MNLFLQIIWVGVGGFIGAVLRYLSTLLGQQLETVTRFPLSVFCVNMLGCFFIGVANGLAESRGILSPPMRLLLVVGFLGSFTTFSTFGHDTLLLAREAAWIKLLLNTVGQVLVGVLLVWLGYAVTLK